MNSNPFRWSWLVAAMLTFACGARDDLNDTHMGGMGVVVTSITGGRAAGGESSAKGGRTGTGGRIPTGGARTNGGSPVLGGTSSVTGGTKASGGMTWSINGGSSNANGGSSSMGGSTFSTTGGASYTGGSAAEGGTAASLTGGTSATGGATASLAGGTSATGGTAASPTGGTSATGGTTTQGTGGTTSAPVCILYVAISSSDTNNGSSWVSAFTNVQPAISAGTNLLSGGTCSSVEIWVAAGTYKPTNLTDSADLRSATFQLAANVALYGGFIGTETARSARDINANVTTLSGDIGTEGDSTDNSYHVITGATGATIDGFAITRGNANGNNLNSRGGGIYNSGVSPTVTNCLFTGNLAGAGGGMCNINSSSPTITNCAFVGNSATGVGGGMYNYPSSAKITNCVFKGNSAAAAGGMYNAHSVVTITQCTFSDNVASQEGGGMINDFSSPTITDTIFLRNSYTSPNMGLYVGGGGMANQNKSSPLITNCTFSGNSAGSGGFGYGGAMFNSVSSSPTLLNCIFWGDVAGKALSSGAEIYNSYNYDQSTVSNPTVTNSVVQGGYTGGTNIVIDNPLLNPDLSLQPSSPAIDSGGCGATVTTVDILGNPRWDIESVTNTTGKGVDIGAFEYQGSTKSGDGIISNVSTCP